MRAFSNWSLFLLSRVWFLYGEALSRSLSPVSNFLSAGLVGRFTRSGLELLILLNQEGSVVRCHRAGGRGLYCIFL